MVIEINIAEWVLHIILIWLVLQLGDTTLSIYQKYQKWRIKNEVEKKHLNNHKENSNSSSNKEPIENDNRPVIKPEYLKESIE